MDRVHSPVATSQVRKRGPDPAPEDCGSSRPPSSHDAVPFVQFSAARSSSVAESDHQLDRIEPVGLGSSLIALDRNAGWIDDITVNTFACSAR